MSTVVIEGNTLEQSNQAIGGTVVVKLKKHNACCKTCGKQGVYSVKSMLCSSCYWKWYDKKEGRGVSRMHALRAKSPARMMLYQFRAKAKQEKIPFDLDEAWFEERLQQGSCEVTHLTFAQRNCGTGRRHFRSPYVASVDRIEGAKGYTKANCRMVIWLYNVAKNAYTDQDVRDLAMIVTLRLAEETENDELVKLLEKYVAKMGRFDYRTSAIRSGNRG
jgi:hypothetical protein